MRYYLRWYPPLRDRLPMSDSNQQRIQFACNICGTANEVEKSRLTREEPSCSSCGSTVRMRSIVQVLTTELFGKSLTIDEIWPPRPDIVGIGMSCWDVYVNRLMHKLRYTNTFYHQEPFLDITKIDPSMEGTLDFIVSTDVFEHVAPPVSRAFENARRLLKHNGVFVMSVPFGTGDASQPDTIEWFPNLHDWHLENPDGDKWVLHNTTVDGRHEVFEDLCFHGGPGSTLEMRRFVRHDLIRQLVNAGFNDITFYSKSHFAHGIHWPHNWSVPLAARVKKRRRSLLDWRAAPPVVREA
ncbi:class I SAM-dependent methyltransferase [Caballeronia sp. LZ032]|uniref:class I SAM-dependent methyltransferase n=1 Tax=Caballeronia sp. LZ032 TaxID=3038565 RepID=UPI0028671186|nr:class I SAM-dependent methyltransferase [Caballeronia sp. LZ032]MDR5881722.1 class I SAM-dependent methyltransferase [Caballeronia sp. LZ032]